MALMRLRAALASGASGVAFGAAAVVPALCGAAPAAVPLRAQVPQAQAVPPVSPPRCGGPATRAFPIEARLTGGPAAYTAGGAARSFSLLLHNTTSAECRDVHPLVVVVDRDRRLTPGRFSLEYAWPQQGPWRSVPFETTDHAENIGLPGGAEGPGLAVPAGRTVTVGFRLRFSAAVAPDRVVASATTMQRRGRDGVWVGESDHYVFDVLAPRSALAGTGAAVRRRHVAATVAPAAGALVLAGAALIVVARRLSRG